MAKSRKVPTFTPYKSYKFKGQDPVLPKVCGFMLDSGKTFTEIHQESGVSLSAMYNWRNRKTISPKFATVNAVARACGQELVFRSVHLSSAKAAVKQKRYLTGADLNYVANVAGF